MEVKKIMSSFHWNMKVSSPDRTFVPCFHPVNISVLIVSFYTSILKPG